jgi:poly-beta-1,6-N-acetyl-D-glucosamine synthase
VNLNYILITAARNEEAFIDVTLRSVIAQTIRPLKWIIVSDGSTDKTDSIVDGYAAQHQWIELFRMPEREARDFSGKAGCFNTAYARIKDLSYDIICSLDADISFEPDYFEFLLTKFADDPKLGLAGTPFSESGVTYDYRFSSTEHVSGACQLFRRKCFDDIGGYTPVRTGGIDVIAVLTARSKGWRTRTFTEKTSIHHRPMGSANHRNKVISHFKFGQRAYTMGYHPMWQLFRSIYQMTRRPYFTGGLALFAGYFWAMLRRVDRPLSRDLVEFQRRDQIRRLQAFFMLRRRHCSQ